MTLKTIALVTLGIILGIGCFAGVFFLEWVIHYGPEWTRFPHTDRNGDLKMATGAGLILGMIAFCVAMLFLSFLSFFAAGSLWEKK